MAWHVYRKAGRHGSRGNAFVGVTMSVNRVWVPFLVRYNALGAVGPTC